MANPNIEGAQLAQNGSRTRLAKLGVVVNSNPGVTDTTLATFTVPGGAVQEGSVIEVSGAFKFTNSANNKTPVVKVTQAATGLAATVAASEVFTTIAGAVLAARIPFTGPATAVLPKNYIGRTGATAPATVTIDPTQDWVITIIATLATTTEELSLYGGEIAHIH